MKKHYFLLALVFLSSVTSTLFSQSLVWNQCNMFNQGSSTNFNYSKTFTAVQQSSTDVQLSVRFLACQPFATNTAGIRLNGTTFSQINATAGNCSYSNNTYTISKSVFNQAVIDGGGTIVFSCYIRDTCSPGTGCSLTSDPCIQFTATYTACTAAVTPTFTQIASICSGATLAPLPTTSENNITGSWSPALNNTATTTYTFTPAAAQCAATTTMTISVTPLVAAPTGNTNQTFCIGETLGNLVVNGTAVVWYDAPTLGNVIDNSVALTAGSTYYASQTIASCESSTRLAVTVTPGACLGNENFGELNLSVFPNPIKNVLNVSCEEVIANITFYNLSGAEILKKHFNSHEAEIDTSNLSSGTYFVKITTNDKEKTLKIIRE